MNAASHDRHVVFENSKGESEITANSLPFLRGFCWALKPMSEMSNTEEREDTACIEITCSVKGYQECNITVDVGEEFFIFKKIGSKGRAFKVTNTKGQLGHLEWTLVSPLWPFKAGMKWWVMIPLTGTYAILFSPGFMEKMAVFLRAIFQVTFVWCDFSMVRSISF